MRTVFNQTDFSSANTLPLSETKTGTITSEGTIIRGSSTKFLTQLSAGFSYIFANGEVRKVTGVISDTKAVIETAFSSNVSGVALKTTQQEYSKVVVAISGSSIVNPKINKSTISVTNANLIMESNIDGRGVEPLVVDSNGGAEFTITVTPL